MCAGGRPVAGRQSRLTLLDHELVDCNEDISSVELGRGLEVLVELANFPEVMDEHNLLRDLLLQEVDPEPAGAEPVLDESHQKPFIERVEKLLADFVLQEVVQADKAILLLDGSLRRAALKPGGKKLDDLERDRNALNVSWLCLYLILDLAEVLLQRVWVIVPQEERRNQSNGGGLLVLTDQLADELLPENLVCHHPADNLFVCDDFFFQEPEVRVQIFYEGFLLARARGALASYLLYLYLCQLQLLLVGVLQELVRHNEDLQRHNRQVKQRIFQRRD